MAAQSKPKYLIFQVAKGFISPAHLAMNLRFGLTDRTPKAKQRPNRRCIENRWWSVLGSN